MQFAWISFLFGNRRRGKMYGVPPPRGLDVAGDGTGDRVVPRVFEAWKGSNVSRSF